MSESSTNSRLEAFSDGVFAIALTLLIIDVGVPASAAINNTHDLWLALADVAPSIVSFLLSFVVILIAWVNHHAALRLLNRFSPQFIYANGFLLLSVVFIPFPTALLGRFLFTDHATPAVVIYSAVIWLQAIGWWLLTVTSLTPHSLAKSEKAKATIIRNRAYSYFAMVLYAACAIAALWFPQIVAAIIALVWIFWIFVGVNLKEE
jgi:uncharacterized membrane protein